MYNVRKDIYAGLRCIMIMKQDILNELVDGIIRILNKKVNRIILYGSVAKGTNTEESDIDDFNKWEKTIPFYHNVNEGVVLWKAA